MENKFNRIAQTTSQWLNYIDSFPEPKDDIERAINHYKCIRLYESKAEKYLKNLICLFLLPFSVIITSIYSLLRINKRKKSECVIFVGGDYINRNDVKSIIPDEFSQKYKSIVVHNNKRHRSYYFSGKSSKEIFDITKNLMKKIPTEPYFILSCFTHMCTVNKLLEMYNAKAIVSIVAESDFTSSLLTHLCEYNNAKYICIMHGEFFLSPMHAFVRFSEFYLWDEFYKLQLIRTRSISDKFKVFCPNIFNAALPKREKKYYFAYYLQEYSIDELYNIRNTLLKITYKGFKCKVRPHKRASIMKDIIKVFGNEPMIDIESCIVSIEDSYAESQFVVSLFSTVLSEAFYNSIPALIDDVSNPALYEALKNVMYINIDRITGRVSDYI